MSLAIHWMTAFVDVPASEPTTFWVHAFGGALSPWRGEHAEFATVVPVTGDPYLRLQRVGSGPAAHLDLHVSSVEPAAREAVGLGAVLEKTLDDLVVLRSPGGFPFCISIWDGETAVPEPLLGSGGGSRADQLALDIPPSLYDAECAFWSALTGRAITPNESREFLSLLAGTGEPLRLLLQRLTSEAPAVTAHLDFACADRDALTAEHEAMGAALVKRNPGWTVMRAPTGHLYCLTGRGL